MGNFALISCLQRIETASAIYRRGPPSPETHGAPKHSLIEGYLLIVAQKGVDPVFDQVRSEILSVCRSIVHALDFGVMEFMPDAPSRHMASELCAELSSLVDGLMPYLMEKDRAA